MYQILTLNKISKTGLAHFDPQTFFCADDIENPDAIVVRSASLHEMDLPANLLAVARAGAGVNNIPLEAYLIVSTIMFFVGVYGFLARRNLLTILMSLELMLNAVDMNFAVFNRILFPGQLDGFFFTLFIIGISAAETALAIAIIIDIYRNVKNIFVDDINKMKH